MHHPHPAEFRAVKPSPVASLSRKQLARWAFDQAVAQNKADADAGLIGRDVALLRFYALRGAYHKRKDDIELSNFLGSRGLARYVGRV